MTYPGPQYPPPHAPQGTYPPQGWAPPPAPKKRKWPWIVGGIVALFVLIGSCNGANRSTSPASSAGPTAIPTVAAVAPSIAAPAPAAEAAPAAGPANSFTDGTYEVGIDIAPGKYRTTGPDPGSVMPMCYTARLKDTSGEFGAIITNDIVKGPGVFTIKKTDNAIEFSGGCTWTKAG